MIVRVDKPIARMGSFDGLPAELTCIATQHHSSNRLFSSRQLHLTAADSIPQLIIYVTL